MSKIQSTGRQHIVTLPEEIIRLMKWKKGTEVYIAKDPDKDRVYITDLPKDKNG